MCISDTSLAFRSLTSPAFSVGPGDIFLKNLWFFDGIKQNHWKFKLHQKLRPHNWKNVFRGGFKNVLTQLLVFNIGQKISSSEWKFRQCASMTRVLRSGVVVIGTTTADLKVWCLTGMLMASVCNSRYPHKVILKVQCPWI